MIPVANERGVGRVGGSGLALPALGHWGRIAIAAKEKRKILRIIMLISATKFFAHGGALAPPSLHSSPAVGEEPPILLACLMAC